MNIIDLEQVRREIDRITPDLRDNMPTSATQLGNHLMAMYLMGVSGFLENDEVPWEELAGQPIMRHLIANSLALDAIKIQGGMK